MSESSPKVPERYLILGEAGDNYYIGFRDQETKKLNGLDLDELQDLGLKAGVINGALVNPNDNYSVTVVRLPKTLFSDNKTKQRGELGNFETEFAFDIAEKLGGFVAPLGIETMPDTIDDMMIAPSTAMANRSFRSLQSEALGFE